MDHLMERLAPMVADFFPAIAGENLDSYAARVRASGKNSGQRGMIAAYLVEASKELQAEKQARKRVWIGTARAAFDPGERESCVICGKYEGLTHAHHTVPLAIQFDAGGTVPIQEFDWLCPTHHSAAHLFINGLVTNRSKSVRGLPPDESDALHRLQVKFVDLLTSLPHWTHLRG
jgi:hypothetical protein